jgi:hypothetical protein
MYHHYMLVIRGLCPLVNLLMAIVRAAPLCSHDDFSPCPNSLGGSTLIDAFAESTTP